MPNRREDSRVKLDDETIKAALQPDRLPPEGSTKLIFDSEIPSFAIRVSPQGAASFCMVYSYGGKARRFKIDRYRTPSLAKQTTNRGITAKEARKEALVLRARIEKGEDIAAGRREERETAKAQDAARLAAAEHRKRKSEATFGALLQAYAAHLKAMGKESWREVERAVERNIIKGAPKLSAMPADEVQVEDFMQALAKLTKAGKYRAAEKLNAYASAAFRCGVKARADATLAEEFGKFGLRANPLQEVTITRKQADDDEGDGRKWALSEAQLAAYWRRIADDPTPAGAMMRFHLLTGGQRVKQLGRLTSEDYDHDLDAVRLFDSKGRRTRKREHWIPLIPDARKAMHAMGRGPFLFSVSGGKEAAVYHTLRDAVLEVSSAMVAANEIDRTFTPGIIRKTVETRLSANNGASKEVRAQLQSHGISGVQDKHYNAHDFLDEKRVALRKLRALCEPKGKPGNVTQIRRKA